MNDRINNQVMSEKREVERRNPLGKLITHHSLLITFSKGEVK